MGGPPAAGPRRSCLLLIRAYLAPARNQATSDWISSSFRLDWAGTSGVWGAVALPAQSSLKDEESQTLVDWVLAGAR